MLGVLFRLLACRQDNRKISFFISYNFTTDYRTMGAQATRLFSAGILKPLQTRYAGYQKSNCWGYEHLLDHPLKKPTAHDWCPGQKMLLAAITPYKALKAGGHGES